MLLWKVFPLRIKLIFSFFRLVLKYNVFRYDTAIKILMKSMKWNLSSKRTMTLSNVADINRMSVYEILKIKDIALHPNLTKLGLQSYFFINDQENVQDLPNTFSKIWLKAG